MESKKSRFITSNHISKYLAKLEPSGAAERRIYAQSTNYYKAVKDIIEIQKRYEYEREKIKSKLHSKLILPSITPEPRLNYKTHSAKKLDKSFDIYGISPTHSPLYRPIMESQTPKVVTLKDRSLSPNIDLDNKKLLLPISMRLKRKEVLRPSQFKGLIVNIPDLLNMDTDSPSPSLNKFEELIFDCDNLVHQNENMVKMIPKARNDFKKPLERLNSLVDAIDICNVDASAERMKDYQNFKQKQQRANNRILYDHEFWDRVKQVNYKAQSNVIRTKKKFWKQTSVIIPKKLDNSILDLLNDKYI